MHIHEVMHIQFIRLATTNQLVSENISKLCKLSNKLVCGGYVCDKVARRPQLRGVVPPCATC